MQDQIKKIDDVVRWGQYQNLSPEQRATVKQNWDYIIENYPRVEFLAYSPYSRVLYLENRYPDTSIYKNQVTLISITLNGGISVHTFKDR